MAFALNCFHSDNESSHLENYRMSLYLLLRRAIVGAALTLSFATTAARAAENPTPLILSVHDAPVAFTGSDGNMHLVYELWMLNFSSGDIAVQRLDILADDKVIQTLDSTAIATRLQPVGLRDSTSTLTKSTQALLFLHITLPGGAAVPHHLTHRITTFIAAAPPAFQHLILTGGETAPDRQIVAVIHPPLAGDNYVSADSCCDSSRHMRAVLGVNNHVWLAQRYAVDWEQLDSHDRIYSGPREKLESYTIFGKPVLVVADATVVSVINNLPEQTPGKYPEGISLDQADGNSVILRLDDPRLGGHVFAMYAHLQPRSIRVHSGDKVHTGEVLGLVGNTGNSLAPHLHFQLMAEPSSLASNGLPYAIDSFEVTAQIPSTEAFDEAEANGTPIPHHRMPTSRHVEKALPLDQFIISFPDLRKDLDKNPDKSLDNERAVERKGMKKPLIQGRAATKADFDSGVAIYYVPNSRSVPYSLGHDLPIRAEIVKLGIGNWPIGHQVSIVQAEITDGQHVTLGIIDGDEQAVCSLADVKLLQ
jgi:hypothetical protein